MPETWKNEKCWTCKYNYSEKIRKNFNLAEKIEIHDVTLRDGEQTPGVVFRKEEKVEIAKKLDEVGIDRIEAGMPSVSDDDFEAIKEIVNLKLNAKIIALCRANIQDIEKAASSGIWGTVIEIPIGEPRLKYQFSWTEEELIEKCIKSIKRAKELGLHVTFFPVDMTRANRNLIKKILTIITKEAKPDSVAIVDTLGCALPQTIALMVNEVKSLVNLPIEVHSHNDFGLGVANELVAVTAGASVVHGSVNGLGERTGNAATEELAVGLKFLLGINTNIQYEKLKDLSKFVEKYSLQTILPYKPIVGERIYSRETGIGIDMLKKHPLAVYPIHPGFFGRVPEVLIGKKSTTTSIKMKLEEHGIELDHNDIKNITVRVKKYAIEKKNLVSDDELIKMAQEYASYKIIFERFT